MSFLFPKMPAAPSMPPIPPAPPPAPVKATGTAVEDNLRTDIKRRKGSRSTIATSAQGLTTEPETSPMSLLGGAGV